MTSSTAHNCEHTVPIEPELTVVDLFSGAGGFSLGALECKFKILGAIEYDEKAYESYYQNIVLDRSPETKILNEDILNIDPLEFRTQLGLKRDDLDLLLGGPPCQGFSSHRINNKGVSDPRNDLLIRYFDFVKELGPKVFLVENVPGLLWQRHKDYLEKFQNLARRHGYKVYTPVKINAKDYGVPQNRERVFILGIRTTIKKLARNLTWPPMATHFDPARGTPSWKPVSTVFPRPPDDVLALLRSKLGDSIVNKLEFLPNLAIDKDKDKSEIYMQHTSDLVERFIQTPIDGSRHDISFRLPCHSKEYNGHKDVYGRIRLAQPGPTITTGCINPSKGRFVHPWLSHGISPRIAARIQTFPSTFKFSGGITSQAKQIGNAVPVELAAALLSSIKPLLIKTKLEETI